MSAYTSVQLSLIRRSKLYVRSNEDIFNNTRNSVLYCGIAIESSNKE